MASKGKTPQRPETPKREKSEGDLSSWVDTNEDSANESIYKSDKENDPDYNPNTPTKKSSKEKAKPIQKKQSNADMKPIQKKQSNADMKPDVNKDKLVKKSSSADVNKDKLVKKPSNADVKPIQKKQSNADVKPDVNKNKPAKKPEKSAKDNKSNKDSSWSSLSAFDEDSSLRSIYRADSKKPPAKPLEKPLNIVPQKCSILQAVETERSDVTNLKDPNNGLDNSLYRDYKAKKKYDFIKPDNEFFGDRDKAQPVRPTLPELKPSSKEDSTKKQNSAENGSNDYLSQAIAKFWSYFGY